jgi:hypothetical protein
MSNNPVLGSTQEFNRYIHERLNPSLSRQSRGTSGINSSLNGDESRSNYAKIIHTNAIKEESYLKSRPKTSSTARPASNSGVRASHQRPSTSTKHEIPGEFVHSWRRHLNERSPSPLPAQTRISIAVPRPVTQEYKSYVDGDDDDMEPRSFNIQRVAQQTISSPSKKSQGSNSGINFPDYDPIAVRVRTKSLQKVFSAWSKESQSSKQRFFKFSLRIEHRHEFFLQLSIFTDWKNDSKSLAHWQRQMIRKEKILFHYWETVKKEICILLILFIDLFSSFHFSQITLQKRIQRLKLFKYFKWHGGKMFFAKLRNLLIVKKLSIRVSSVFLSSPS